MPNAARGWRAGSPTRPSAQQRSKRSKRSSGDRKCRRSTRRVWVMGNPAAQSDDCYSRISFRTVAGGDEVEGVLGWREGAENRVVFQVWDGPSFAAEGRDLAAAFAAAHAGIIRAGFAPRAPSVGDLADLFAEVETKNAGLSPR